MIGIDALLLAVLPLFGVLQSLHFGKVQQSCHRFAVCEFFCSPAANLPPLRGCQFVYSFSTDMSPLRGFPALNIVSTDMSPLRGCEFVIERPTGC